GGPVSTRSCRRPGPSPTPTTPTTASRSPTPTPAPAAGGFEPGSPEGPHGGADAGPDAADEHTTRLPVTPPAGSPATGRDEVEPPTSRMPAVGRPGTPDPLTAPFSDIEDALRRDGGTPAHPGAAAAPDAEDTPADPAPGGDPVSGRARPVDDRPWPPPPTGSPSTPQHPDRHDQARQEDH
ncbi:hypothetical protein ABT341_24680, partial [Pseudonocardia alni]